MIVGDVGGGGEVAGPAAAGERSPDVTTLRVPDDYETIQGAVDDADPGDLVLVSPGVYEEAVTVEILSAWIHHELAGPLRADGAEVVGVRVWEAEDAFGGIRASV